LVPTTWLVDSPVDPGTTYGTLRYAVANAGDSDEILGVLPGPVFLAPTSGELVVTQKHLRIESLSIFEGIYAPAFGALPVARVFEIKPGASVIMDNVFITQGGGVAANPIGTPGDDGLGGGILNLGRLSLNACAVDVNSASLGGGAIYNAGTLTVANSDLSDNNCGATLGGGAIYNAGTLAVSNSNLSGNNSAGSGGAMYNAGRIAAVSNSTFFGNTASFAGGAIFNLGRLTVTDSTLSGNSAGQFGGGICSGSPPGLTIQPPTLPPFGGILITITGSDVSENVAGTQGGGVFNSGLLTTFDTTISGNFASNGGGIANDGTATIDSSIVSGNVADKQGGGIYNFNNGATLTLDNNTFVSGNSAYDGGGAFNDAGATLMVRHNSVIGDNYATTNPEVSGSGSVIVDTGGAIW